MGDFREHGVLLYLDKTLYKAFIRLQADRGLGRSYAGLLPFTEGLFRLGFLSSEDYEVHIRKYSEGIAEKPQPLPAQQLEEKKELERKQKVFSMVLEQWNQHPSSVWRAKWVRQAEKWKDRVANAQLVLALTNSGEAES